MRNFLFISLLIPLLGCGHSEPASPVQETGMVSRELTAKIPVNAEKDQQKVTAQNMDTTTAVKKRSVIIDVPLIRQNPELKYGCEVTSLTMLLQHAGVKVGKMDLYDAVKKIMIR